MPQDVRELGRRVKAKYPGKYDDLADDEVGRRVKRKYPGAYDDFTDTPAAQPLGLLENIGIGAKRFGAKAAQTALSISEAVQGLKRGDVRPIGEAVEVAARGALSILAPVNPGAALASAYAESKTRPLATAMQQREARQTTESPYSEGFQQMRGALQSADVRAALDPSLKGKLVRGGTELGLTALPAVATGFATGGSLPAMATVSALQSAGQPETAALNVALGTVPIPAGQAFRAGVNSVRRAFGKGAAQVIEAEATPAAVAQVRQSIAEVPPVVGKAVPTPPSATSLQSVFAKLETDNVEQIGAMIANANRRLQKGITPEQRISAWEDYNRLKQITADEHRALSQVLPARNFNPPVHGYRGGPDYERAISDIPTGERSAQLDANLRELEAFFGGQVTAPRIAAETALPAPQPAMQGYGIQQAFSNLGIGDNLKKALRDSVAKTGKLPGPERNSAIGKAYEAAVAGGAPRNVATLDKVLQSLEQPAGLQIAGRMAGMARTPTSPVELPVLRAEFPGLSKQQFDDKVLKLAEQGQVAIHRHDFPASLSEAERNAMVKVGNDYYTAATVRGPSVSAPLDAMNVAAAAPGRPAPPLPPGGVPTGFGGLPPRGQQQLFDAAARSPWQDTVLAYFRGNLLTGYVGRANDLGQTIINQFADAPVRPIAAAVDRILLSPGTKERAITGLSLRGTGQAFKSIPQGLRDALEALRTGRQTIESGANDVLYGSEVRSGLGKVFDVPVNGVFRLLGALDAPFRRFGYARNLFDRAKVAAINEAKRGKIPWEQKTARIRELMDKPDIINAAIRDGEKTVLSESNQFSAWVAKQTQNSPNARLAVGIIQPFLRIPANAAMKAADFAGVGGVKALYKVARGLGRKAKGRTFFRDLEDQRVFAQNVAAGSFGVAGFLLGMELEERGKLEGFYYTSGKDYPNGKVPTSINIGGKNYDVNRLGGFVFAPLFVGATYNRLRKKDVGKANALLSSFSGLAQQIPGLGYYGAPAKGLRILTAEKKGTELAKQGVDIGVGFIPAGGLVRAGAKAFDLLPQKGARSAVIDASLERNRPLFTELQRLNKRVSELRKKDGEKDDAFNARVQQFSANYTRFGQELLNSPRFQAAPDALKAIALDRLDQRAKAITHREFAFPEIELDANIIMDAAEQSKKNPANK